MNLNLTGHHLDITPAIRDYVVTKLERVTRHFDHVIDVTVVLSVDKLQHCIEANVHIPGQDIHIKTILPRLPLHRPRLDHRARRKQKSRQAGKQGGFRP